MTRRGKKFEEAIDGLIAAARITKDAAELAPFPGIKGAVGTVLVLLEAIKATKTNRDNCLLLAKEASELVETLHREIAHAPTQINSSLDAVVQTFVSSLEGIVGTIQELAGRKMVGRLFLHASDSDAIAECRHQLEQSFRVFMTVTQVQIREEQQKQHERSQEEFRRAQEERQRARELQEKEHQRSQEEFRRAQEERQRARELEEKEHQRVLKELQRARDEEEKEHQRVLEKLRLAEEEQRRTAQAQHLSRLQVASARWNEAKTCLQGTRVTLLNQIRAWGQTSDSSIKPICWLADVAGSGKSTVANQMASEWKKSNQLGGCFFFSRNVAENNDLKRFCGTVASDLAEWYPDLKILICDAIEKSPSIMSRPFQEQFETLISGPLNQARRRFIIVIDALDECSVEDRALLLHVLFSIGRSTMPMKVFVTSRPEHDILESIVASGQLHVRFDLHGETNISDVRQYVISQLSSLNSPNHSGGWRGPSTQEITTIAERAGGLFIWASTACKMVKDSVNPQRLVSRLVNDGSLKSLDKLYLEALMAATLSEDPHEREEVALVLHAIVTVMEPLSVEAIDELLGINFTGSVVKRLGSVLSFGGRGDPVRILHPTFLEFLTSSERCTDPIIHADSARTHGRLSEGCFGILQRLRHDICDIGDPSLFNSEVPNLEEKVDQAFPETLRYACRFWLQHTAGSGRRKVLDFALEFFKVHFLHWIEAMSLMRRSNEGAWALLHLRTRINDNFEAPSELQIWCRDALRFVQVNQHVVHNSALQVYISALAFTPSSTSISRGEVTENANLPSVLQGRDLAWTTWLTLKGHTDTVGSVVFSPDGTRIASGSYDDTIRIWDAVSGSPVGAALEGHSDHVNCVSFSPDGTLLVSGSDDKTIRLWNAVTGSATGTVLRGHTGTVGTVAFSPDGSRIASGSSDKTIRIWDVMSGTLEAALEGNEDEVTCVTFSPNGTLLASGTGNYTIRIWDLTTRPIVGAVIQGSYVGESMKFSPDGVWIASSSGSKICIWDLASRSVVCDAFEGHNSIVNDISFSPDGTRIASASEDSTVRIWDTKSGTTLGMPFKGHSGPVRSIAFSPDGAQIASGALDDTVRIWNAAADSEFGSVFQGHPGPISYITFSPDTARIASISRDKTVRIWETASGSPIGGPFEGFDSPVVFSHDGNTIAARSKNGATCHWELRDSAWTRLPPMSSVAAMQSQATELRPNSVEDEVELKRDGWVYQVGSDRRRLFYVPLVNRSNDNWGEDRGVIAAVSGAVLVVGSQYGHITIIDCSPLLK